MVVTQIAAGNGPAEGGGHCLMAVRHPQKLGSAFCKNMTPMPWGGRLFPSVG